MGENDFMPLPGERFYTIDAFYAMPEGERAELINGQPYRTAAQYYKGEFRIKNTPKAECYQPCRRNVPDNFFIFHAVTFLRSVILESIDSITASYTLEDPLYCWIWFMMDFSWL